MARNTAVSASGYIEDNYGRGRNKIIKVTMPLLIFLVNLEAVRKEVASTYIDKAEMRYGPR